MPRHTPAIKVRVENGRYIIDETTELPDGTELLVVLASEADEELAAARGSASKSPKTEFAWSDMKAELGLY